MLIIWTYVFVEDSFVLFLGGGGRRFHFSAPYVSIKLDLFCVLCMHNHIFAREKERQILCNTLNLQKERTSLHNMHFKQIFVLDF